MHGYMRHSFLSLLILNACEEKSVYIHQNYSRVKTIAFRGEECLVSKTVASPGIHEPIKPVCRTFLWLQKWTGCVLFNVLLWCKATLPKVTVNSGSSKTVLFASAFATPQP